MPLATAGRVMETPGLWLLIALAEVFAGAVTRWLTHAGHGPRFALKAVSGLSPLH